MATKIYRAINKLVKTLSRKEFLTFAGELRGFYGVLGINIFCGEPEAANFWDWRFGMVL